MRFKVRYLPLAMQDLEQMAGYLLHFYPDTAGRTLREIEQKLAALAEMPELYEEYAPNPFYRRMVAGKYLVFYHVNKPMLTIDVYRVLRGAWDVKQWLAQEE